MARILCLLLLLLPLPVFAQSDDLGLLLDDFDSSTRLQHWAFSNGVAFDDLRLLSTPDMRFNLDPSAAVVLPPEGAGELRPRLGVNVHFLKDDRALDLVRDAGFSFVRMDLLWATLEKQAHYDFTPFDDLMRSLEARDLGVLWILAYGHPRHGGKAPQSTDDVAAYARYAAAVVAHFRGHKARFEIWNEPNSKEFLANPRIYPELLRAALHAIRREDPAAAVSSGGVSGFDLPFLTRVLQSGSAREASAVAVHPYRESGPETVIPDLMLLESLLRHTAGAPVAVWDTEWGYPSYGFFAKDFPGDGHSEPARQRQAVLAARECLTVWALGLPIAVWYDLRDDGPDPRNREHNFGLLNQDNSDKAAMKAVRVLTTLARNHTYTGLIRDVPYGLHAMRLDGSEDIVFVVWNDQRDARPELRFLRDELMSASNLFGEPIAATPDSGRYERLKLEEQMGPLYIRLKRPSPVGVHPGLPN